MTINILFEPRKNILKFVTLPWKQPVKDKFEEKCNMPDVLWLL